MKRRGIANPLRCDLPKVMDNKTLLKCYKAYRYPISDGIRAQARETLIANYYRLAISAACGAAYKHPFRFDDFIGEALCELVAAVDRMGRGALDHHEGEPNIGGYIQLSVNGKLNWFNSKDHIISVHPRTYKKMIEKPQLQQYAKTYKELNSIEIDEILDTFSDVEKKVIRMRMDGHIDKSIGLEFGKTDSWVQQVRYRVRSKIKEKLNGCKRMA